MQSLSEAQFGIELVRARWSNDETQKTQALLWVGIAFFTFTSIASWVQKRVALTATFKNSHEDCTAAAYRIVGCIHHTVQLPLAATILVSSEFWADRVHGHNAISRALLCISSGYFLHDLVHALQHFKTQGWGYVIHGMGCAGVYLGSLLLGDARGAPLFHFYGAGFMLWELSSYFLHARWFMFKLGSSKKLQLINGLALIASYFLCRIVWGFYLSYLFINDSRSLGLGAGYIALMWAANLSLNALNCYWFSLIMSKAVEALSGRSKQAAGSFGKRD